MDYKEQATRIVQKALARIQPKLEHSKKVLQAKLSSLPPKERGAVIWETIQRMNKEIASPPSLPAFSYMPYYDPVEHGAEQLAILLIPLLRDRDEGYNYPTDAIFKQRIIDIGWRKLYRDYLKELAGTLDAPPEQLLANKKPKKNKQEEKRKALVWKLAQDIVKEFPGTGKFGDKDSVHQVHFPKLEELTLGWELLKADTPKEWFEEKLRAKFKELEAESRAKMEKINPEEASPFPGDITGTRDERIKWAKENQQEKLDYLYTFLFNTLAIRYGTALFLDERAETKLGEKVRQIVKDALEAKGLLAMPVGQFTGKKMQIKALYNVLVKRGYVSSGIPEEQFASWFLNNFGTSITGRALRNARSRGQKEEERDFLSLIPTSK